MALMKKLNGYEVCDQTARDKAQTAKDAADAAQTTANGKANTSHTHNASNITEGILPIARGGTGSYTTSGARISINDIGSNPIKSKTDDTTANWGNLGSGTCFYSTANQLNGQPSQWGILLNCAKGTEVHQLWMAQSNGSIYHRGGNASGFSSTWTKIHDDKNQPPITISSSAAPSTGTPNSVHIQLL